MLSASIAAFRCRLKLVNIPLALAVIVTACAVATEDTAAVNPALAAPAGTVAEFGTVTAGLLRDRFTIRPLLGARVLSVTVHASLSDPVITPLLQDSALSAAGAAVPEPLRLIIAVPFV
jgi:hypothetical protein